MCPGFDGPHTQVGEHSKLPWRHETCLEQHNTHLRVILCATDPGYGRYVAEYVEPQDADLIVAAVNSFDSLTKERDELRAMLEKLTALYFIGDDRHAGICVCTACQARQLLDRIAVQEPTTQP